MYLYTIRDINTLEVLAVGSEDDYRTGKVRNMIRNLRIEGRYVEVIEKKLSRKA